MGEYIHGQKMEIYTNPFRVCGKFLEECTGTLDLGADSWGEDGTLLFISAFLHVCRFYHVSLSLA